MDKGEGCGWVAGEVSNWLVQNVADKLDFVTKNLTLNLEVLLSNFH